MSNEVEHFEDEDLEIEVTKEVAPQSGNKKEKVLTEKQKLFLSVLGNEANGDIRTAMKLAGYSDYTRPDDVLSKLTEEIMEVANKMLAHNSVKAVSKIVGVLDDPARPGNRDVIAAAKELLDRAGVLKKSDGNGSGPNIKADVVFILPPKEPVDKGKLLE